MKPERLIALCIAALAIAACGRLENAPNGSVDELQEVAEPEEVALPAMREYPAPAGSSPGPLAEQEIARRKSEGLAMDKEEADWADDALVGDEVAGERWRSAEHIPDELGFSTRSDSDQFGAYARSNEAPLRQGVITEESRVAAVGKSDSFDEPMDAGRLAAVLRDESAVPASAPADFEALGREEGAEDRRARSDIPPPSPVLAPPPPLEAPDPHDRAREFIAAMRTLDDLATKEPTGYWSNTYVPGDAISARLVEHALGWHPERFGLHRIAAAEQGIRPPRQPFDPPEGAALALYMHADRAAVTERSRLLLQVGLRGSEARSGVRPAMNVCMVIDHRQALAAAEVAIARALVRALSKSAQAGDRFCLVTAGFAQPVAIPAGGFRYGAVRLALEDLFDAPAKPPVATGPVALKVALDAAYDQLSASDDPSAVMGSSLVLLVTPNDLRPLDEGVRGLVYAQALGGIHLSTIVMGNASLEATDTLVHAGQGHRRLIARPDQATALIERELTSATRAVARAVRVRIRLQPGVELIDVLGSKRLDLDQSARAKRVERVLDRRVADRLGIKADRGDDEEGIQILIPHFDAGDNHVILLDVVVPGPGPIADARVRYKDLIALRNGVAAVALSLPLGEQAVGPLEWNVLKNRLSWELVRTLDAVSDLVGRDQYPQAQARIADLLALYRGMRLEMPGWSNDPELLADEGALGEYMTLLGPSTRPSVASYQIAAALRYAARLKSMPR